VERLHAWTEEQEPYRSPFVRSVDGADRGAKRIVARASKKRPFRRQRCPAPLQSLSTCPQRGKGRGCLRRLKAPDRTGFDCGDQRSGCTDAPGRHRRRSGSHVEDADHGGHSSGTGPVTVVGKRSVRSS
jgi:hypothetical protein